MLLCMLLLSFSYLRSNQQLNQAIQQQILKEALSFHLLFRARLYGLYRQSILLFHSLLLVDFQSITQWYFTKRNCHFLSENDQSTLPPNASTTALIGRSVLPSKIIGLNLRFFFSIHSEVFGSYLEDNYCFYYLFFKCCRDCMI